jgi:chemotaxis protein MotB
MAISMRLSLFCVVGLFAFGQTACNCVPRSQLVQCQRRAVCLYREHQSMAAQNGTLLSEKSNLENQLSIANSRIDNLRAEREQLQQRYISMLNGGKNPLSDETSRRFEELAKKYPEFEFDPNTGVSKFNTDILFASGDATIRKEATPLLADFAKIMNEGDARMLNILVVGHTDDKPIVKKATQSQHPTNWHLSTDRADSVVLALSKQGIAEGRMGAAGYSMHQPLVANTNDKTRQRNRRVEIFVLAPDAVVAGWDPKTSRN